MIQILLKRLIFVHHHVQNAMTYKVLDDAVELYRTRELGLSAAAARAGVSSSELAAELRSNGVALRDGDDEIATTTRY